MRNDLQPCPFCGGTARFNETEDGGYFIECTNCRSSTCLRYSLMDDAKPILAESWNRRVQLAAAAPGDDDAKDAAPSDELTVKCAYCGKQTTKGRECLNARFAMECRQSR